MRALRRGLGAAAYLHVGGGARIYPSDGCGSILRIDEAGRVTLVTGASELGQGSETVLAMIVAEALGVPLGAIRVLNQDTEVKPWDVGAHASRTTFVAGNSARLAALELREKLLETAAEVLEADAADLELDEGRISIRGSPGRSISYDRVARRRLLRQGGSMPSPAPSTTPRRSLRTAGTSATSQPRTASALTSPRWRWTSRPAWWRSSISGARTTWAGR
jgi:xanthine dehydrogenase molybdenum-binding subunit